MLVSKNLDIDLIKREKKTLLSFLALYSFLSIVIILIVSFLYFDFQKNIMLQNKRVLMQEYSNKLITKLKHLHINFDTKRVYPRFQKFNSAIYDSDKTLIFSTLTNKDVEHEKNTYLKNKQIHFINQPESYYLGSKYVVVEIQDDEMWLKKVKRDILFYAILAFAFAIFAGYFILKLFLRPLREALILLDRFIKDTTHELNTPVSTIMTNIEMIDRSKLDEKTNKKINRIDIGAKTISNIYDDLIYLTLNSKLISKNENIDIKEIVSQRVEYFKTIADSRKINITLNIKDENIYLQIDRIKISKLIDNIISNAIKYNKINGTIVINVSKEKIIIEDSGIGIAKDKLETIFNRYIRVDNSVGGFGIGLSIVSLIAKEYNLKVKFDSIVNQGTKVSIIW